MSRFKSFTRKDLKQPDEFITFTGKMFSFVQSNYKLLSYIFIGFLVIFLIFLAFRQYSIRTELKASDLFNEAMKYYNAEVKDGSQIAEDEKKSDVITFKDIKEKYTKALAEFEKVIKEYPNSNSANLSKVYSAHCNYFLGNYDGAIELYKRVMGKFRDETKINLLVLDSLAHSYENKGDYKQAIEFYDKILKGEGDFLKDYSLYNIGRCYKASNDVTRAKEYYERVMKEYPKSKLDDDVKRVLLLL